MLDPILLRKDLQTVVDRLKTRGVSFDTERFNDLESRRKAVQTETESLQARRNALAKQIGQLKAKGEDASAVMAESQAVPVRLKQLEEELAALQQPLNELLMSVPNLPHASARWASRPTTTSKCAAGCRPPPAPTAIRSRWPSKRATTSPWASRWAWISTWPPSCPARASLSCAARSPACTARWPSSCWTCRPARTATPSAIRPISSMLRRCMARASCPSSGRHVRRVQGRRR